MAKQESIINIEKENIAEAEFMSRGLVNTETKKRAYINALGAELAIKYLESEGIGAKKSHNLHSISKILEKYDIADIMLPNIHIDTRVVFNENQIFIPKSHFANNLVPDVYFVLKLSSDFKYAQILGFIKPDEIDKNNENKDYCFVEKDKLTSADEFKSFVTGFKGDTDSKIDENKLLKGRELYIHMADHNISAKDEKSLIKLLLASDELRESVLEFDNFETLSYSVGNTVSERLAETETVETLPELDDFEDSQDESETDEEQEEIVEEEIEDEETDESEEVVEQDTEIDDLEEVEISESLQVDTEELDVSEQSDLNTEELDTTSLEDITLADEPQAEELPEITEDSVDEIGEIDETDEIGAIDTIDKVDEIGEIDDIGTIGEITEIDPIDEIGEIDEVGEVEETTDDLQEELEPSKDKKDKPQAADTVIEAAKTIAATAAAAAATAATAKSAEVSAAAAISDEAIKLANVSGELVNEIVNKELEDQQVHLDRIDYAKTKTNATEVPEHIAAYDLSDAKEKADREAEKAGLVEKTNLEDLKTREIPETIGYGDNIEQETINLSEMKTVETEKFSEHTDNLENLENLTSIDSPTKPVDNLEEKMLAQDLPEDSLDFSNMSSFDINDDGTSSIDNINIDYNPHKEEELVDIGLGTNDIVINTKEDDSHYLNNNLDFNTSQEINLDLSDENSEPENLDAELTTDESEEETLQDFPQKQESQDYSVEELSLDDLSIFEETENSESAQQQTTEDNEFAREEQAPIESEDTNVEQDDNLLDEIAEEEPIEEIEQTEESTEQGYFTDEQIKDTSAQEISEDETISDDWMDDTNYDNLPDAQIPQPQKATSDPEIIEDTEIISEEAPQAAVESVEENSTVISDKTLTAGEIPIDINEPIDSDFEGNEQIQNLYKPNNNVPGAAFLNSSGKIGTNNSGKKAVGGVFGVILTLLVVGGIGFGVSKMLKHPTEETPQPITDEAVPTAEDNGVTESDTLSLNPDDVVNMEDNKPTTSAPQKEITSKPAQTNAAKTPAAKGQKTIGETAFIEVSKLSWEVPDYISYNPQFKQYFQSTGRRLKLALSSDLLLATDAVHTNQARVSVLFDKDGTFKVAKILLSSGSTQIDNIVLQTVNQTLKTLKAPHSMGNDESTTVILKIYF